MNRAILITGGAGFIGSHVVRRFVKQYKEYTIINLDKLTYAGNLKNLKDIESADNYHFVQGDIRDAQLVKQLFERYGFDGVIHLAAESHVDRSILSPMEFIYSNIVGTVVLLNAACEFWKGNLQGKRFYQISTDEVYGSLEESGYFTEQTPYDPKSPYSASKASADHFVRAYYNTYNLPVVLSNCSNNYGPYQFPEKLIPLTINNIVQKKNIPVYGKGENIRDWLHVEDHAQAIDLIFHKGKNGETYNVGGRNEWKNIDLVYTICELMDSRLGRHQGSSAELITFVKDREGHDKRYAIDTTKISQELNWNPSFSFKEGLAHTIDWYLAHPDWLKDALSEDFEQYYKKQYKNR